MALQGSCNGLRQAELHSSLSMSLRRSENRARRLLELRGLGSAQARGYEGFRIEFVAFQGFRASGFRGFRLSGFRVHGHEVVQHRPTTLHLG